jgi:ABC-type multidrug transport system ATPase subunit
LEQDLQKPLFKLSGGTKKKVEFAKCLLCDTPIYLVDEPFTGFDVISRKVGYNTLKRLRGQGKAILLCDHEQRVLGLSDRVLELREGHLTPILIEEVVQKMQVEAEVKGWREELKQVLAKLPEVEEITAQTAPMSEDEIAAILQKAGIDPGANKAKVIYMDGEPDELSTQILHEAQLRRSACSLPVVQRHDTTVKAVLTQLRCLIFTFRYLYHS